MNLRLLPLAMAFGPLLSLSARHISGQLASDDATLSSGEFKDNYYFIAREGQTIVVDLNSKEFDPYLILSSPGDESWDSDDYRGDSQQSHLELIARETGVYSVTATSFKPGETGSYELTIPDYTAHSDLEFAPTSRHKGSLKASDNTLKTGEFSDTYQFEGVMGHLVRITLDSKDFSTYLILRAPSGIQQETAAFEGDPHRSLLEAVLSETGTYEILVTSEKVGETGSYTLESPDKISGSPIPIGGAESVVLQGQLAEGDHALNSGELVDTYAFHGLAGQHVVIDVTAKGFDPYLILKKPGDTQVDNDDWEGSSTHSRLELDLERSGHYKVLVTTYKAGETGSYRLQLPVPAYARHVSQPRTLSGELTTKDEKIKSGEFADTFLFEALAGDPIVVDLTSSDFDTYLFLKAPSGEQEDNDDWDKSKSHSRIETIAAESGTYKVVVTTYKPGETGAYTLTCPGQ